VEKTRRYSLAYLKATSLFFQTVNGTTHLYGNLKDRWLTPRLVTMGLDEEGMG
jgi:hypothetical protein